MAGNGVNIAQSRSCTSFIYIIIKKTNKTKTKKMLNSNYLFLCILN